MPANGAKRNSMRTRAALFTAASLSLAVLLPVSALASTSEEEKDDGKVKTKTIKVVTVGGSNGFLGVGVADVDDDRAKDLGLHEDYGVEVNSVVKNSAADKAGVKKGDVVLEYNGSKVENTAQFIRMIRETRPGRQVKLAVFRDGHTTTLTGQMEKRPQPQVYWKSKGDDEDFYSFSSPDTPEPPEPPDFDLDDDDVTITIPDIDIHIPDIPSPNMSWRTPRLGVETEGLGTQLAEFFGVKDGVLVRSVIKGSAAEKAGLKAGDVIVKLGGEEVSRPGDISSVLRSTDATDLPIVVMRNRKEVSMTAKIEARSKATTTPKKRSGLFMVPMPPPTPMPDMEEDEDEADDL
jgi:serine protease Do